jgi:pantoate--beta-alanine ligase
MSDKKIPTSPQLVARRDELRRAVAAGRSRGAKIGVVPTMGALHAGHLSLVEAARRECDFVIATIFVNPTQFAPTEDFAAYPRDLRRDAELLAPLGVDLVFAPSSDEMYRPGHETYVEIGPTAQPLEGTRRPTHFRGVATVVLKLLNLVEADIAYFGEKDYQQTLVVRRMVDDFDLNVEIRVRPIVREPDGLAMSSRNAYLSADERRRALSLSQSLELAARLHAEGERSSEKIRGQMLAHLEAAGGVEVEYIAFLAEDTVAPVEQIAGPTRVALAAQVGQTRLIDNRLIE